MQLKDSIHKLVHKNKEVDTFIETAYRMGADEALADYVRYLESSNYNAALGPSFAQVLQFCSDPDLDEQFTNKDIEHLYDSLIEVNEQFIDLYTDAASFADRRLQDKEKAKRIVAMGIDKLNAQLKELQELYDWI